MSYNIRKNWVSTCGLMLRQPIVMLPFIVVAFLEALALEFIYFSPRKPISFLVNPIVRKFSGELFVHYPGNLIILPKLFYYAQLVIYVFCGVFLTAIAVNIFKNIKMGLPLKTKALVKNALSRYPAFFGYGLIMVTLILIIGRLDKLPFLKLPLLGMILDLFLINVVMQTFLILVVPIIVTKKKSLLKAVGGSICLGWRNFISIFGLIILPFVVFLPISILKSYSVRLIDKTFPEINLCLAAVGIIVTIFLDCFVFICAAQFLMDKMRPKLMERTK